jgi:hypothetical protein
MCMKTLQQRLAIAARLMRAQATSEGAESDAAAEDGEGREGASRKRRRRRALPAKPKAEDTQ